MQRWEYLCRSMGAQHLNGPWSWYNEDWKDMSLEEALTLLGSQGWELVGVTYACLGVMHYFKRPLPDDDHA